jgi:two-component system, LytTR family, response regulator
MGIKALIVDDEYQGRSFLSKILAKLYPEIDVVDEASSIDEAVRKIGQHKPNLIFLDIIIQNQNGFDIFNLIDKIDFEIIFTTAHNEFAVKAFKFNAIDYLLKPIDLDELDNAIAKAKVRIEAAKSATPFQIENLINFVKNRDKPFNKIAIPTSDGFILVPLDDIIYCESDGNYTNFFLKDGKKLTSSYTLKQYDEMLADHNFFRAHKSYLVNVSHITRYLKGEGGTVIMSNGREIEISRRNKESLLRLIKT